MLIRANQILININCKIFFSVTCISLICLFLIVLYIVTQLITNFTVQVLVCHLYCLSEPLVDLHKYNQSQSNMTVNYTSLHLKFLYYLATIILSKSIIYHTILYHFRVEMSISVDLCQESLYRIWTAYFHP